MAHIAEFSTVCDQVSDLSNTELYLLAGYVGDEIKKRKMSDELADKSTAKRDGIFKNSYDDFPPSCPEKLYARRVLMQFRDRSNDKETNEKEMDELHIISGE